MAGWVYLYLYLYLYLLKIWIVDVRFNDFWGDSEGARCRENACTRDGWETLEGYCDLRTCVVSLFYDDGGDGVGFRACGLCQDTRKGLLCFVNYVDTYQSSRLYVLLFL